MVAINMLLTVMVTLMLLEPLSAGKILGYLITPTLSHFIVHESLMRELAAQGHEVTVVSFFPTPAKPIGNYTAIQLEMSPETKAEWGKMSNNLLESAEKDEMLIFKMPSMLETVGKINRETYTNPAVQKLRLENTFDVVIFGWFFNDYQLGLATHFKCPAIVIASMSPLKIHHNLVGNPSGPAFASAGLAAPPLAINFKGRLLNFGSNMLEAAVFGAIKYFAHDAEYKTNFPPESFPSFDDAKKNVALVLVASHFSQEGPIASFPSMVEVSGMHIKKKADPLPKNIQQWLDTAEDGVIFFSLGSSIKSIHLPAEKRDALLRVFGRIRQRVLWKWEDDELPGKPDNVMVQKWLPQDDVLAHPNVKLFISHCGLGGVNEARYHGVPILGIPVNGDQPKNLQGIVDEGWAVALPYSVLDEQTLDVALTEVLTNKSYGLVVKEAADLFRDRPQHPLDTAVYWVEYVMRHKGAKHMQSQAIELYWYQYHSLDVIGTLLVAVWLWFKINVFVWPRLWRFMWSNRRTQTIQNKKND